MHARIHSGPDEQLVEMNIPVAVLVAVLASGCAAFNNAHYMPSEEKLKSQNPYLLNCAAGTVPFCEAYGGGRFATRYRNCVCSRGPIQ